MQFWFRNCVLRTSWLSVVSWGPEIWSGACSSILLLSLGRIGFFDQAHCVSELLCLVFPCIDNSCLVATLLTPSPLSIFISGVFSTKPSIAIHSKIASSTQDTLSISLTWLLVIGSLSLTYLSCFVLLECKLLEGKNFWLFYSLLEPQWLSCAWHMVLKNWLLND